MHLVVSTLVPSGTGGVKRSTIVTLVEGCRLAMATAVDKPKMPAPMIITSDGMCCWNAFAVSTGRDPISVNLVNRKSDVYERRNDAKQGWIYATILEYQGSEVVG